MYSIGMCIAIRYKIPSADAVIERVTTFREPHAKLPIKLKHKGHKMLAWGRRIHEAGNLPLGACVFLEQIQAGDWNEFFPKPVIILAQAFIGRDIEGENHWHDLVRGNYLQGVVARYVNELRIYVVTIRPQLPNAIYEHWPRIITAANPLDP